MKTLDRQKLDVTNKTRSNIFGWLRNWNTVEFLGVRESICNPAFNSGEFATIKSQAGRRVNSDSNPVEFDGIRIQAKEPTPGFNSLEFDGIRNQLN